MRHDPELREFTKYLLKLGNEELPENSVDEIELPVNILSNSHLIHYIFGNYLKERNYQEMSGRTILAPLYKDVTKINDEIIERLLGECKIYKGYDSIIGKSSIKDQLEGAFQFTTEFLNSIDIGDLPLHELKV